ncbi:cytochrome P450 [Saccharothrix sp. ST-888]|uniref:cytochrome P450 n=1 Tax=Saccharothrix sp. ST-888 TaxID=1427391 RepID=UPI0005EC43CB|nr:cytochrome P450 [Saccharothrix sp. ST-888]KJK58566.1 cytochrome P450 [Saccharothrix sp. ST-888]
MTVEHGETSSAQPLIPLHCLRHAEPGPPRLTALPNGTPVWLATRHADVRQVLTDPRLDRATLFAPDAPPTSTGPNLLDDPEGLLNIDGPEHQRLRRTVQRAFTPRAIARWRPWVETVIEELIDDLEAAGSPVDVVAGLTRSLPIAVISRLMDLDGVDLQRLGHWSDHALSTSAYPAEQVRQAMREFYAFSEQLIADRRKNPGDDLVSSLLLAAAETEGVTEGQLTAMVCGLVVAGHETTMTSFGNALVQLLSEAPEAWARIAVDLADATAASEQILRAIPLSDATALPGLLRRAVADLEIGGVAIAAGSVVAADIRTANHDPEVYPAIGPLDHFAPLGTPSLTFGAGPHHCLGAWLARMELELGLHRLANRLPGLRLAGPLEEISWREGLLTRSPASLLVAW